MAASDATSCCVSAEAGGQRAEKTCSRAASCAHPFHHAWSMCCVLWSQAFSRNWVPHVIATHAAARTIQPSQQHCSVSWCALVRIGATLCSNLQTTQVLQRRDHNTWRDILNTRKCGHLLVTTTCYALGAYSHRGNRIRMACGRLGLWITIACSRCASGVAVDMCPTISAKGCEVRRLLCCRTCWHACHAPSLRDLGQPRSLRRISNNNI